MEMIENRDITERRLLKIWSIILCIIISYVMVYLRISFMMKKILIAFNKL